MLSVNLKWGKQKYTLDLNTNEPPIEFKSQIYALTGVLPERQKVMGVKGGVLKDDADWASLGIKEGHSFMLIGSAEEIPKAPEKATVFVEDLSDDQAQSLAQSLFPPGLTNLGNTCYMNATLQCFRKVPELNTALKSFTTAEGDNASSVTTSLRDLFAYMDVSNQSTTPLMFLQVLRRAFPQFAQKDNHGHFMQQDAEECWSQLMLSLSQKLPRVTGAEAPAQGSSSSKPNAISDLFSGSLDVSWKCTESEEAPTSTSESFVKLACHIGNNTAFLLTGLKETLEESITKRSEQLGREAKFLKSSRISKLPHYLTVQFVRFFWRADKNLKAKIVKPVEFPFILDVFDLCTPDLQKALVPRRRELEEQEEKRLERERERAKRAKEDPEAKEKTADAEAKPEESKEVNPAGQPSSYVNDSGKYELVAVLTHKGRDADSGHYVAWVKQAADKWLKYDDDRVSEVPSDEIKKLDGKGGGDWHIAYMCLYRTYTPV